MKYVLGVFSLLVGFCASGVHSTTLAIEVRGVELIANDGSLYARVFVGVDSLLLDFPVQQRGYLFRRGSYVLLNRSDQTYRVHSYASVVASVPHEASSDTDSSQNPNRGVGAGGFTVTEETAVIAGFSTTKLVRTSQGKVEVEMWVSEEDIPSGLRAVRREIGDILPANFWDHDYPKPTLFQAIMVFGLPLRIVNQSDRGELKGVAMKSEDIRNDVLEIPPNYRQIEPKPEGPQNRIP